MGGGNIKSIDGYASVQRGNFAARFEEMRHSMREKDADYPFLIFF